MTTSSTIPEAIASAEAQARDGHDAGTCHQSEWTCSFCEVEDQGNDEIPSALTKADQMAWEAPELRPILHLLDEDPMELASECPTWCTGDGIGHRADDDMFQIARKHTSPELCLRTEAHWPYWAGDDGAAWAHLAFSLERSQMGSVTKVAIHQRYGEKGTGEMKAFYVATLYLHEVRELVAVLQHLLKVGQEQ